MTSKEILEKYELSVVKIVHPSIDRIREVLVDFIPAWKRTALPRVRWSPMWDFIDRLEDQTEVVQRARRSYQPVLTPIEITNENFKTIQIIAVAEALKRLIDQNSIKSETLRKIEGGVIWEINEIWRDEEGGNVITHDLSIEEVEKIRYFFSHQTYKESLINLGMEMIKTYVEYNALTRKTWKRRHLASYSFFEPLENKTASQIEGILEESELIFFIRKGCNAHQSMADMLNQAPDIGVEWAIVRNNDLNNIEMMFGGKAPGLGKYQDLMQHRIKRLAKIVLSE